VAALTANPTIETVVLSIRGNGILAAKSGGGWYKDMDLDNAGSEEALFNTIEANTQSIIDAVLAVRPNINVLLSSYDFVNFNVNPFLCLFYACPKRQDLSRDPDNDLMVEITGKQHDVFYLQIVDILGRIVEVQSIELGEDGLNRLRLNLPSDLTKGNYMLNVFGEEIQLAVKVI